MYRWNQILICCHKAFFIFFGLFGNVNLIFIILSTRKLRTKSSYLQAIQTFSHVFCIFNSFIDIYLLTNNTTIPRSTCFYLIFPGIFCFCIQSTMMFVILLDLLLIVLFPVAMRAVNSLKYILLMTALPCLWAFGIVFWGFQDLDDRPLILCNPPAALHGPVRNALFPTAVVLNTLSLALYIVLLCLFAKKKDNRKSDYSKVMTHLKASAALFIATTYMTYFATTFFILLGYTGENFYNVNGNIAIFAMISYSHTFYTIIWRSPDYRRRFLQIYCKSPSSQVTVFTPSQMNQKSTLY